MKRTILTCILLIAFILSGLAQQSGLEFKRKISQKTKYLQEGKKIRVKSDGKSYKGRFELISDNAILIGSDTLLLTDIQDIRISSVLSSLGGGLLTVYGTYGTAAMIYGIALIATEGSELAVLGVLLFSTMGFGAAILAVTGFAMMVHGKSHKSKRWEYKTLRTQIPANQIM